MDFRTSENVIRSPNVCVKCLTSNYSTQLVFLNSMLDLLIKVIPAGYERRNIEEVLNHLGRSAKEEDDCLIPV